MRSVRFVGCELILTGQGCAWLSASWARFSAGACGAKLHLVLDPDADRPVYAAITPSRVNDITAAHAMPIEPGATYVFDLGYYGLAWWAKLDAAGCRIVSRLKANTRLPTASSWTCPATVRSCRTGSATYPNA